MLMLIALAKRDFTCVIMGMKGHASESRDHVGRARSALGRAPRRPGPLTLRGHSTGLTDRRSLQVRSARRPRRAAAGRRCRPGIAACGCSSAEALTPLTPLSFTESTLSRWRERGFFLEK
jgi:hypothetical protein